MNSTEERLRDALHTAARIVDAPPPFTAPARRFSLARPLAAAVAVAAVVGGAVFFTRDLTPAPSPGEAFAPPAERYQVSVYLCIKRSSNALCQGRAATEQQRQAINDMLEALPGVREVTYESKEEAFERFRTLFQDEPGLLAATKAGGIPDSFRVKADPGTAPKILLALSGFPGVDQVVDDESLRDASRN